MGTVTARATGATARRRGPGLGLGLVLGLVLVALAVALLVEARGTLPGERSLLLALRPAPGGTVEELAVLVRDATDGGVLALVAAAAGAALLAVGRRRDVVVLAVCVAVPLVVNPLLKRASARPRPELWPAAGEASAYALPSGHAVGSAALVGGALLVLRGPARRVLAWLAAPLLLLVGAAQLVAGVHWPSDLLVGWLWAAAWVCAVASWARAGP
jgi:undecaprenyl-diphosphatase